MKDRREDMARSRETRSRFRRRHSGSRSGRPFFAGIRFQILYMSSVASGLER